jgi:hypothetical protein
MSSQYVVIVGRPPAECEPLSNALKTDSLEVKVCGAPPDGEVHANK